MDLESNFLVCKNIIRESPHIFRGGTSMSYGKHLHIFVGNTCRCFDPGINIFWSGIDISRSESRYLVRMRSSSQAPRCHQLEMQAYFSGCKLHVCSCLTSKAGDPINIEGVGILSQPSRPWQLARPATPSILKGMASSASLAGPAHSQPA